MPAFFHEKSDLYRKALELAAAANQVAMSLPRERYYLKNQIWRCSLSVPCNIAEGLAARSIKTRLNYFAISNGSAAECSAIFDAVVRFGLLPPEKLPYAIAREVGAMLSASLRHR
ncbi:MAG TPA: four helix bundle protein [Longimicrobiales bacterium]